MQRAALGHFILRVPPASCSQGLGALLSRALVPQGCGVPGGEGSCHRPVALCLGRGDTGGPCGPLGSRCSSVLPCAAIAGSLMMRD